MTARSAGSEIWRAIPGHPNYEVSNYFRVRSIDRVLEQGNGWGTGVMTRTIKGRILKTRVGARRGSRRSRESRQTTESYVTLPCNHRQTNFKVNALVHAAFPELREEKK